MPKVFDFDWPRVSPRSVGESLLDSEARSYKSFVVQDLLRRGTEVRSIRHRSDLNLVFGLAPDDRGDAIAMMTPGQFAAIGDLGIPIHVVDPCGFQILARHASYGRPFEEWMSSIESADAVVAAAETTGRPVRWSTSEPDSESRNVLPWFPASGDHHEVSTSSGVYVSSEKGPFDNSFDLARRVRQGVLPVVRNSSRMKWETGLGGRGDLWPVGFFPSELWGMWAEEPNAAVFLPKAFRGRVRLALELIGTGSNVGRQIEVEFGSHSFQVVLPSVLSRFEFEMELSEPVDALLFTGYLFDTEVDHRGLGVGVASVSVTTVGPWSGSPCGWSFVEYLDEDIVPEGFFQPESWGAWASSTDATILLPFHVTGPVRVVIGLKGCGSNVGREIEVGLGSESRLLHLTDDVVDHVFDFETTSPADRLTLRGFLLDHEVDVRGLGVGVAHVALRRMIDWDGEPRSWSLRLGEHSEVNLREFHPKEWWGVWSAKINAEILLPLRVSGSFRLVVDLIGSGENVGRKVQVHCGSESCSVVLGDSISTHVLEFELTEPSDRIRLSGYELDTTSEARWLGVGVGSVRIERRRGVPELFRRLVPGKRDRRSDSSSTDGESEDLMTEQYRLGTFAAESRVRIFSWIRPVDLLWDCWSDIAKSVVESHGDNPDVSMCLACPVEWSSRLLPDVGTLMTRLQPHKCHVGFVFTETGSSDFRRLMDEANVVVLPRPDEPLGMEWFVSKGREVFEVQISTTSQPRQLVPFEKSPLVATRVFQPASLVEALRFVGGEPERFSDQGVVVLRGANVSAADFNRAQIFPATSLRSERVFHDE